MNKENSRVYIDSSLRSTISNQIVETSSLTIKEFCENAVSDHCKEIKGHTSSYRVMRKVIDYLTDMTGIDESIPSTNINPKLGNDRRNKEVRLEVHSDVKSTINSVEDDIGISHSKANAMCVLYHANEHTNEDPHSKRLDRKVNDMITELKRPLSPFHRILNDYFSLFYNEETKDIIQSNREQFNEFSNVYTNEFINSKAYSIVEKYYGSYTLDRTEQVIDRQSKFNIDKRKM